VLDRPDAEVGLAEVKAPLGVGGFGGSVALTPAGGRGGREFDQRPDVVGDELRDVDAAL
jgi:hypothetical protein